MLKASINHAVLSSGSRQCNTISTEVQKADGRMADALTYIKEQTSREHAEDFSTYVQM
jgi:hypothetical protein